MKLPYSFNLRNTFQLGSIQRNPIRIYCTIATATYPEYFQPYVDHRKHLGENSEKTN